ncbi:hypothetical protein BCD96_003509 [Clostridium beijerinckii]|nr:hypothetical protein [Clostridium beijerinckii]NRT72819.1 hypothetical protein [Clostridium beijerinckii]NRU38105.1 hypothetical protein [Clostridium beijerinckii]NRY59216.1 hypothetical protein [Clostridium beijerinckii]NSA98616.1 hypothetical protein [Clostridium beijerinckii]
MRKADLEGSLLKYDRKKYWTAILLMFRKE